jgi:hypothetical protein
MGIAVDDPFEIQGDPAMPVLLRAIDPNAVYPHLKNCLTQFCGKNICIELLAIRVQQYRPGHDCTVEYDVAVESSGRYLERIVLVGRTKAGMMETLNYQILRSFWRGGFDVNHPDQICVPEPVGLVPPLQMWFQRKVNGTPVGILLGGPDGISIARRIAEALSKVHKMNIPNYGCHTLVDELRLAHQRVDVLSKQKPHWKVRLQQIRRFAEEIVPPTHRVQLRGIHRDFDLDHVLMDGPKLYLVGFERYCKGDPSLDAANFLAHLTMQSFRQFGDASRLLIVQESLQERFLELEGSWNRASLETYKMLRLIRQVYVAARDCDEDSMAEGVMDSYLERSCVPEIQKSAPQTQSSWQSRYAAALS